MIVVPLTTTHRGLSLHVDVEANSFTGLEVSSVIQCELLRSINRRRLIRQIGAADVETSEAVASVIRTLLNY